MEDIHTALTEVWNANWTELMTELKTEGKHFISSFIKSVDWSEKWIWCIFAVLCAWFVMILVNRESFYFQLFVFIVDSCIVFGGRTLNKLGSRYWKYFATRNYFDEDGLFFSFVISLPLLLITCVQTFILLFSIVRVNSDIRRFKLLEEKHKELEQINEKIRQLEHLSEGKEEGEGELRKRKVKAATID
ncbi:hypothetical protein BLSTO_01033 [Blastocystis sp. subtype 1]